MSDNTIYIRLDITETERVNLNARSYHRYAFTETFKDIDGLKEYLIDRYGKMPGGRNKVYADKTDGSIQEVGFTHSFWRDPQCYGDKRAYQTDWISIVDVVETPILITA